MSNVEIFTFSQFRGSNYAEFNQLTKISVGDMELITLLFALTLRALTLTVLNSHVFDIVPVRSSPILVTLT